MAGAGKTTMAHWLVEQKGALDLTSATVPRIRFAIAKILDKGATLPYMLVIDAAPSSILYLLAEFQKGTIAVQDLKKNKKFGPNTAKTVTLTDNHQIVVFTDRRPDPDEGELGGLDLSMTVIEAATIIA